ncbi:MAG: 2-hydroxyacyl-CoA dehydratase [Chloroflexota bacterium]|nr:MAG: 2-hydroxyacyl-CoA dehydratase [Chloroflexota bacterium]
MVQALGMQRVEDLYHDRTRRAQELRTQGRKVVGYFCCYPPVELLSALDLVPYRIQGDVDQQVQAGDEYLETMTCSFVRSCFDLALTGKYDFLDGLVVPHSCDTVQRIYDMWRGLCPPDLVHFLNVPHMVQPSSFDFFKQELLRLQSALEDLAGKKLEPETLRQAVDAHNENRALLRRLYELRKSDAPPIAGSEVLKVIVAGMGMPVAEHNALMRQIIAEVLSRPTCENVNRPRVMLCGSEIDNATFIRMLEEAGADVVVDDLCTGTRSFWANVPTTSDPLDGIAFRYLNDINCPRTYRSQSQPRAADLENRFSFLGRFAHDFRVDGVVLCIIRFCDTHELEAPDVIDYFSSKGIPTLHLEEEYRLANIGQIKTRLEAFLETIGGNL